MSRIAETAFGRVMRMPDGHPYALEMPYGDWERMSAEQYAGKVSVDHAKACRSGTCTYHEQHGWTMRWTRE